jgi:hypothetical protein
MAVIINARSLHYAPAFSAGRTHSLAGFVKSAGRGSMEEEEEVVCLYCHMRLVLDT